MKTSFLTKVSLFVATGGGISLIVPFAPGTFGSFFGVALAYATTSLPVWLQIPICTALAIAAIPFCDVAEKYFAIKDDGRIVADEWMLYPLALIGLPISSLPWWAMVIFFAVVRIIDIIKPFPANRLQSIPGGRGIVIDDFVANIYSLAINWFLYWIIFV